MFSYKDRVNKPKGLSYMPSLFRFIVFCAVIAGIAYGSMFALIKFTKPNPREVQVRVQTDALKLN